MSVSMTSLVPLSQWPSGRRAVCLERLAALLEGSGLGRLRALVDAALAADMATYKLEERWDTRSKTRGLYAPEARALGGKLCRTLSALDGALAALVRVWEPDSHPGRLASRARELLFPGGVAQLTRQSYVELYASVEGLLRQVDHDPELARSLRELEAERLLTRLAQLSALFHTALRPERAKVTYAEVEQARAAGQERLAEILIHVASQLKLSEPGSPQATALERALDEILSHDEELRRTHRRRQRVAKARARATRELDHTGEAELADAGVDRAVPPAPRTGNAPELSAGEHSAGEHSVAGDETLTEPVTGIGAGTHSDTAYGTVAPRVPSAADDPGAGDPQDPAGELREPRPDPRLSPASSPGAAHGTPPVWAPRVHTSLPLTRRSRHSRSVARLRLLDRPGQKPDPPPGPRERPPPFRPSSD